MSQKIRKLSIGAEVKDRFHYVVNEERAVYTAIINNRSEKFNLAQIIECETHYQLWLKKGDEIFHWKDEPKNNIVTPEYFLD
jgi:hypothetical protein